jgi:hypothetical protein
MSDHTERRAWVERVLGFRWPQAAASGPAKQLPPLLPLWRDAKDTVDAGIGKLRDVMHAEDNEDLDAIADKGLYGIGQRQTTLLMAALIDADRGATPQALARVTEAVSSYQDFLDGSPVVDLLEKNPFGVSVPMRKTLGAALAEIGRHVAV